MQLGIDKLWSRADEAYAWKELERAVESLRGYRPKSRRDRMSKAGASALAAHLRSLLTRSQYPGVAEPYQTRANLTLESIVEIVSENSRMIPRRLTVRTLSRCFR